MRTPSPSPGDSGPVERDGLGDVPEVTMADALIRSLRGDPTDVIAEAASIGALLGCPAVVERADRLG